MTAKRAGAGSLSERIAFDRHEEVEDGYGGTQGALVEQFACAARIMPLKGGEGTQAARLAGTQPVIIQVRYSTAATLIQTDWQARDTRSGTIYQIKSIANMDERKKYLDIMATAGVAA